MTTYKVPNLTAKTPQPDRNKLLSALKGVPGVASATLIPETSEFSVEGRAKKDPNPEEIESAASRAGFAVTRE